MTNITMQAARAHDYGAPEILVLEQVEVPAPNADQVLIRLKFAGVNPADWKFQAGYYKQYVPLTFPWTPAMAVAASSCKSEIIRR